MNLIYYFCDRPPVVNKAGFKIRAPLFIHEIASAWLLETTWQVRKD